MLFTPAVDSQSADGPGPRLLKEIPLTQVLDERSYLTELETGPDQGPARRRSGPHQIFPLICYEGSDVPSQPPTREPNWLFFLERKPEAQWLIYIFSKLNANAVRTTKVVLIGHSCQPLCVSLAKASGPETNLVINIKHFVAHQINRDTTYTLCHQWPLCDQHNDL